MVQQMSVQSRRRIWERDQGICGICSLPISDFEQMDVDRIIPQFQGGTYVDDNVRATHLSCNRSRGSKEGATVRPPRPLKDRNMERKNVMLDDTAKSAGTYLALHLGDVGLSAAIRFALFQTAKRKGWKPESAVERRSTRPSPAAEHAEGTEP